MSLRKLRLPLNDLNWEMTAPLTAALHSTRYTVSADAARHMVVGLRLLRVFIITTDQVEGGANMEDVRMRILAEERHPGNLKLSPGIPAEARQIAIEAEYMRGSIWCEPLAFLVLNLQDWRISEDTICRWERVCREYSIDDGAMKMPPTTRSN